MDYKKTILALGLPLLMMSCGIFKKGKGRDFSGKFENVKIAEAKSGDFLGPCEPTISVNHANPKNIAAGAVLNLYYWSHDGGRTWKNGSLKSSYGVFGDPVIIADWQGNFYYAHLSDPEERGWSSDSLLDRVVIQKSTDGGKTYSDGSFTGNRAPHDQDKHWLVADPKTNDLFCAWTEFDKYNSTLPSDHSRILFSKSTDGGTTWSDALKINQFEGDCLDDDNTTEGAVPAVGPNGEVYVAWSWNNRIWFDRSTDSGKTWLQKDIIVADQPGGWTFEIPGVSRCNGMPVLVCDLSNGPNRGTLYLNWADQRNGEMDTDIWLSRSTDGGNSWSPPLRVNNDPPGKQQFLTWLTIDQATGNLYVVFYDRRETSENWTDVYVAASTDGGKKFKNMKISQSPFDPVSHIFFGDYNHISAHNGIVRPIWTRMDNGKLSIWTAIMDMK